MARTLRPLGQSAPGAAVLTDIYTVGAGTTSIVSSVIIADRGGTATTFRLGVAPGGEADDPKHYLAYDSAIDANDSVDYTIGATLQAGDVIRGRGAVETLSFNVFGEEIGSA
jgi:hypothetical protein